MTQSSSFSPPVAKLGRTITLKPNSGPTQVFVYWVEKFGDAWFYMLGIGVIHHHAPAVPPLGYWVMFLLTFLMTNSTAMQTPVLNKLNTVRKVLK